MKTQHTPGPWKVMADPMNAGKHPFYDARWIATAGTEIEFGHDPRSWHTEGGSLICEMRDGPEANARLIAAAPELLAANLTADAAIAEALAEAHRLNDAARATVFNPAAFELLGSALKQARAAIAKATA
jgi:hypothetical protein